MKLRQFLSTRIRSTKAATDPILVIASIAITLVLLVGGSFAVSGIIANAHKVNAKSDLDKVAVAEAAAYADGSAFIAYDSKTSKGLEAGSIGFTPTTGANAHLVVVRNTKGTDAWAAVSRADTSGGELFIRTSQSSTIANADPKTGALLEPTAAESVTVAAALSTMGVTTAELFAGVSK